MVIGKGTSYGSAAEVDPSWPSFSGDADLAAHIEAHGDAPCTITAGDVLTTLGGGAPPGVSARAYPLDLLEVQLDGGPVRFAAAHVVARRRWWSGQFLAAMNAAYVDGLYLGPRSHPNDGLVDTTIGRLRIQQRVMARSRAATGVHLPHPEMKLTRKKSINHTFDRSTPIRVDGVMMGEAKVISVKVHPDAGLVVV